MYTNASMDFRWGLPYDANVPRTFINQDSGGGQGSLTGNFNWYRLHFKVDPMYVDRNFFDLEGARYRRSGFHRRHITAGRQRW